MNPVLPQPTGAELLIWLGCGASVLAALFFLVGLYNAVMKARDYARGGARGKNEISPQPLEVKEHERIATEKDCLARFLQNEKDIMDLRRAREADQRESSIHRKSMYDKLEGSRRELVQQNDAIRKELSDKIDEMPNKMVALLKNTGAI